MIGPAEVATMILMFCGTPSGLDVEDACFNHMINCVVEKKGTVTDKRVKECLLMKPEDRKTYE